MNFILRAWDAEDAENLVKYANNFNIAKNMTDAFPHPYTIADAKRFIEFATKDNPIHIFAIDIHGEAVGGIGIHPQSDIHRKNAELGYWLAQDFWSKGIITKAIREIVDFAFTAYDINRVFARPYGSNLASQRVLEKSGFKLEGRFEKTIFKNGEYLDELIYAIRR
jgi:RimJ/RimL family protein N-acetyltransferase